LKATWQNPRYLYLLFKYNKDNAGDFLEFFLEFIDRLASLIKGLSILTALFSCFFSASDCGKNLAVIACGI